MKVTIMNDELSSDFESALELLRLWGLDAVEIRRAGDRRYPDVSDYWRVRVPQMVREYGLSVASISPGLFKIRYPGSPAPFHFHRGQDVEQWEHDAEAEKLLDYHVNDLLPSSIRAAEELGAGIIVIWNFERHGSGPAEEGVIQVLRHAAKCAASAGTTLAIEVQDRCDYVADIVQRVGHENLAVSWTPASAYAAGEQVPFPDGYQLLRPWIRHVHFKDAAKNAAQAGAAPKWVLDGVIDWQGQIAQLKKDGYQGYVSVEPHVRPQIDAAKRTLDRLRSLIEAA
jgi:sugar phosphate isomerase/epimerase